MTRTIFKTNFYVKLGSYCMLFWGILVIYGKDVWQSPLYNFEER